MTTRTRAYATPGRNTFVISLVALLLTAFAFAGMATAQNPVPLINQPLVPDAVKPGAAGFTLTLNGTGFVSGATVNWNGSPLTTTFVSGSQLKASILATDVAKAGTAWITVVNPSPGGGVSNTVFFPVTLSVNFFVSESTFPAVQDPTTWQLQISITTGNSTLLFAIPAAAM